ncbi:MAG: DNA primase [Bacteroidetes bacterium]|nr:DNA primase [Bacteroidota bacterium]
MIPKETIQKILEAARIEEVIGEYVNLKKSGKNYKGFSPFTNETNPSFYVSPSKNIFKCFSSNKGGNVVSFLMELEHYTYPEALRFLAKKYNIEIEEKEPDPDEILKMNERETLFHVTAFAQNYFSDQLLATEEGKAVGLSYFRERGFHNDTIKKFQLGYSPEEWEAFTKYALEHGYNKDYLVKTGLSVDKENGRLYDRFRGRVMFPIHNVSGRVMGFGGRILVKDDKKPKYVNSPESEIYNKSEVLYGLYFAKNAIIRDDNCYLTEGYTDVISLHQSGIENVVASSGTALTQEQIRLIRRYTLNITILYDGDEAGLKASFRGIDLILEEGLNVRIVMFPEGEDPDSFVRKHRITEVTDYLKAEARDFIRFKTSLLNRDAEGDPIKKAGLIKEIVKTISLVPEPIFRNVYVKECSTVLDIPEQTLMNELNRILRKRISNKTSHGSDESIPGETKYTAPVQKIPDPLDTAYQEKDIIRLLLNYGSDLIDIEELDERNRPVVKKYPVAKFILADILQDDIRFSDPVFQKIFDEYHNFDKRDMIPDTRHFIDHEDSEIRSMAVDLLSLSYELSKNWESKKIFVPTEKDRLKITVQTSLLALKAREVEKEIFRNQKRLKDISADDDVFMLVEEQKELKKISREINTRLSRIITR